MAMILSGQFWRLLATLVRLDIAAGVAITAALLIFLALH
jgi:hypothetical protein